MKGRKKEKEKEEKIYIWYDIHTIILMHYFSGYESLNPYTLQSAYYQHALMGQQAGIATLERPRYSATE